MVNAILAAAGRPPVMRLMPLWLARSAAGVLEGSYCLLRLAGEPPLTHFLVSELTRPHWFDTSAARRDLGYEPRVSLDEGMARLRTWFGAATP
jgi:nucleoside-diphosphate-sugar epimerase